MINWHTPWQETLDNPLAPRVPGANVRLEPGIEPLSARGALETARLMILALDPYARLRRVVSVGAVDREGRASAWDFDFDAPSLRFTGTIHCKQEPKSRQWVYTAHRLPFPLPGSPEHRAFNSGWLSHRWVEACWRSHWEANRAIPWDFIDSSAPSSSPTPAAGLVLENRGGATQWAPRVPARQIRGLD